jgi:hypothetical protein
MKAIKKILLLIIFLCFTAALSACGGSNGEDTPPTPPPTPQPTATPTPTPGTTQDPAHSPPVSNEIAGGAFVDGIYLINRGGRFVFSGDFVGQIIIDADRNDVVELVLDGMSLHNPYGAAVYAMRSRRVEIYLPAGTVNSVSDGAATGAAAGDRANAAIFTQHDLYISGSGVLNVHGRYNGGIRSSDYIRIDGGMFNINAVGDAIRGRDGVIINGGAFTLDAGRDGIRSNHDTNPERGFITINGGLLVINAGDDGIQAFTDVTINGGNIHVNSFDDGITANGDIIINGGNITVHSFTDAMEADGTVYLRGGYVHLSGAMGRTVNGTYVFAGGNLISTGNYLTVSAHSHHPLVSIAFIQPQASGTLIEARNEAVHLTHTAPSAFALLVISAEELAVDDVLYIYLNNVRVEEIIIGGRITSVTR